MRQAGLRRLRNWLIGSARGEIQSAPLDGPRAAGAAAYALAEEADRVRDEAGPDPWSHERGVRVLALCAWNAFALQTCGDSLLDADSRGDPLTAGLVPEVTYAFARECYEGAMTWIRHARCVQADPAYRVSSPLPAALPPWVQSETLEVHLAGLVAAHEALAPRAEHELRRLQGLVQLDRSGQVAEMNRTAAQMRSSLEFARRLAAHARSSEQRREARDQLLEALGAALLLGQLVVMPSLTQRLGPREEAHGPLASIRVGASVVDALGAPVGTVARVEGEPELGVVSGLVVSVDLFSSDRRVAAADIESVRRGVVRLARTAAELEPV